MRAFWIHSINSLTLIAIQTLVSFTHTFLQVQLASSVGRGKTSLRPRSSFLNRKSWFRNPKVKTFLEISKESPTKNKLTSNRKASQPWQSHKETAVNGAMQERHQHTPWSFYFNQVLSFSIFMDPSLHSYNIITLLIESNMLLFT